MKLGGDMEGVGVGTADKCGYELNTLYIYMKLQKNYIVCKGNSQALSNI